MRPILSLPIWALVAFVLYKLIIFINTRRRYALLLDKLGCKPTPVLPSTDPLGIRNILDVFDAASKGKLLDLITRRQDIVSQREGRTVLTYQLQFLRNWWYVTTDPKNVQALLATQFSDFELGPVRFGTFSGLLGRGIFSADGKQWEHSRALLRPQFVRDQVSDLDLEERHLQNMLKALPVGRDGWTYVTDIQTLNFRLTIDSATEFLFGESVDSQLAALPDHDGSLKTTKDQDAAFVAAFELSQNCIANAFRMNDWHRLGLTKEYYANAKICHDYIDRFVQKALNHHGEKPEKLGEKERYTFLEGLAERTQDPIEIRDQLLSILVAGRDTTASLLGFLWLMLSQHEEVFNKLRKTVIDEFGPYSSTDKISFSSLKACSYLQWCMNETLRLFPTVPLNSRRSTKDTTLPRGGGPDGLSPVFIPKDTEVNYAIYVVHRHKDFWGPDADSFKPERWEGRKPGFEYLPFNGGPRICLGQQFALTEAGYVTVRLLQRFDKIDGSAMNGLDLDWSLALTGRPMYGVKLRLHEASEI